ncbi:MAG: alpha/beta hydrolase family protein, partial [Opitutaceae bacterium]
VQKILISARSQPEVLLLAGAGRDAGYLFKYNVRTRKSFAFHDPRISEGYVYFDMEGNPRIESQVDGSGIHYWIRVKPNSGWRRLDATVKQPGLHFDCSGSNLLDRVADIIRFGPDGNTLYIGSRVGSDCFKLAAYDVSTGRISRTIAQLPHVDLSNSDFLDFRPLFAKHTSRLLGLIFEDVRPRVAWLDPRFAAIQRMMDAARPNHFNEPIDWTDDGTTMVYLSSSDQDAGTYFVVHPDRGEMIPLLQRDSYLKGKPLAKTEYLRFPARDGHLIPAYLTRPVGASDPVPLVVLIHGGPMARDTWGFSAWNQFLASRGYAVLQVNYRGSSGYGAAYQKAGLEARLDTVVLDDIADGARYLIDRGVADPKRVVAMGASFGGWATYMSLIKYPDLYRAGIALAAVSDWRKAISDDRWWFNNPGSANFWKALLRNYDGGPADRFIEPVLRAAELRQPILIAQGGQDHVVSSEEAQRMLDALRKTNSNVVPVDLPNSSHSYMPFDDQVIFLDAVAAFLDTYVSGSR